VKSRRGSASCFACRRVRQSINGLPGRARWR
jgi:hypothetical protein